MKSVTIIPIVFLLMQAAVFTASGDDDRDVFREAAAHRSVLYRGRAADEYRTMAYNGNPYWESPYFISGTVVCDGHLYEDVLLNIDAYRCNLQVRYAEGMAPVILPEDRVTSCEIGGERFVSLQALGYDDARPGFYKVISEAPEMVFQRVDKILKTSTESVNGTPIGYQDPAYRYNVQKYFYRDETFFWVKDGVKLKKIGRGKARKLSDGKM